MTTRVSYPLIATLLAACVLSACGRAGAPLTPYESAVKQAKEDGTAAPEKPVKEKPFILDGLLK